MTKDAFKAGDFIEDKWGRRYTVKSFRGDYMLAKMETTPYCIYITSYEFGNYTKIG